MIKKAFSWLRSNLGSLVLALGLSITVWVTATLEQNPFIEDEFPTTIPVEVIGLAPNLIITNEPATTANVRLRAQDSEWQNINASDIRVVADLTGLESGTHQVQLQVQIDRELPVTVLGPNPDRMRVVIEERGEREFPVRLNVEGQPAIGYEIDSPRVDPADVVVRGPLSRVDLVSEVRATISVESRRDSLRSDLPLVALDSDGNPVEGVTISPGQVTADIRIKQVADYKYISIIPRTVGRVTPGYYITSVVVTPSQVVVQGDPQLLENLPPSIDTFIDVTGLTDDVVVDVTLNLPPGVTIVDEGPIRAQVTVAAQPGSRALTIPLAIVNLSDGLLVEILPDEIEILLSGPLPILDALDVESDIVAILDLAGLGPGTYQVEPRIELRIGGLIVEQYFPPTIEVTIEIDLNPEN